MNPVASLWNRLRYAATAAFRDPELHAPRPYPAFDADRCASAFIRNHELMQEYLRGLGIPATVFLQPALGVGGRPAAVGERPMTRHLERRIDHNGCSQLEAHRRFHDAVASLARSKQGLRFVDLSGAFDDIDGVVFLDQVHPADHGVDRLASLMAKCVARHSGTPR